MWPSGRHTTKQRLPTIGVPTPTRFGVFIVDEPRDILRYNIIEPSLSASTPTVTTPTSIRNETKRNNDAERRCLGFELGSLRIQGDDVMANVVEGYRRWRNILLSRSTCIKLSSYEGLSKADLIIRGLSVVVTCEKYNCTEFVWPSRFVLFSVCKIVNIQINFSFGKVKWSMLYGVRSMLHVSNVDALKSVYFWGGG